MRAISKCLIGYLVVCTAQVQLKTIWRLGDNLNRTGQAENIYYMWENILHTQEARRTGAGNQQVPDWLSCGMYCAGSA